MDVPFLQIGSKISIISKANVRYDGIFVEIDTDNLQIALSDVRFYGTETRAAEVFIAAQERVYPFVIFKSTDIKEIRVINNIETEKPESPVPMNGFVRRDYPQSTLEFLRTFPLSPCNTSQNGLQVPNSISSFQRGIWTRCSPSRYTRGRRRSSPYMWRIPRVIDFAGRSGDPNELPIESNGENFIFDQEYDFEKNNKLFEDLLNGITELNLNKSSDSAENEEEIDSKSPQLQECEEKEMEQKFEEIISKPINGATPKKCTVCIPKTKQLTPTAYNKAKSFFDTVSCASIYRSPNSNPNWREWNKETFGIPMVRHQRRKRRSKLNAIEGSQEDEKVFVKNTEQIISDETKGNEHTEENVTVQKIHFQAVVVTKTRGYKSTSDGSSTQNYEKTCKDQSIAI